MELYVIVRRNGFASTDDLGEAAGRSTAEGDKPDSGVRWIRSYVVAEDGGELGTFCITRPRARRPSGPTRRPPSCPSTRSCRSPTPSSCGRTRCRRRPERQCEAGGPPCGPPGRPPYLAIVSITTSK
jgi:hypothetical protein